MYYPPHPSPQLQHPAAESLPPCQCCLQRVRFVDTYSCVAATEDRARIMEFFMTHDDEAELLIQSPYIRAKLQIMCDAVRRYFDTAGWGTPRWERLL